MRRRSLLHTLSISNPLVWGLLGLLLSFTSCALPGKARLIVWLFSPCLVLASFLAWLRPLWSRWILVSLGAGTVLLFGLALWRLGFSFFFLGFLSMGVCDILVGLVWTNNLEERSENDAEEGQTGTEQSCTRKRLRIAELLESNDVDELLSLVFKRIMRRYGSDLNVMELKEHERVFLLAYDAWGIIGNGGFNYLFERSIPGDPHYEQTASAFAAIGCDAAADAFAKVFQLFPGGRPPEEVEERLRLYRRGPGTMRGPIDEQFFAASKDMEKYLHAYVRAHGEQFAELDHLPPRRRSAKKRKRRARTDAAEGQTVGDLICSLPHWARVAFAARCGRSVWPLFTANWPDASPKRRQAVTRALELAELSAAGARAADGLEDAVTNAVVAAGGAMMGLYGFFFDKEDDEPRPPDGNAAVIASFVARAAEHAADAANKPPAESAHFALEAFTWVRQAVGDESQIIETLWRELRQLERVARRGGWSDQTPVPSNVWDLLE
ncbi:MAG TPA: DUF4375 domain-containing protein [Gemmataceae bacterium]|jgi:hypothetical protein